MNRYQKMNPLVSHHKQLGWALIAGCALLASLLVWRQSFSLVTVANAALPNLQGAAALEHLRQQGLYTSLESAVSAARRMVRPATTERSISPRLPLAKQMKRDAAYLAHNAEQRLRARFTASGAEVTPQTGADWRLGLQLRGYGYPGQMRTTQPGTIRAAGQRVELRHQTAGDATDAPAAITEWYENVAAGLEHGFTVAEPVERRLSWQPLQIALAVSGDLAATLDEDGQGVTLRGAGDAALRYDHLAVYDTLGQSLVARMELSGDELRLVVEEQQAVYPLTIDPILGQQQKLAVAVAADPYQSGVTDGAKLGTAVAISGDTAVVGAPNRILPLAYVNYYDEIGQIYIFARNGSSWNLVQSFYHGGPGEEGKDYGSAIAISGGIIVVGSPKSFDVHPTHGCPLPTSQCYEVGRVYTYTKQADGSWSAQYPRLHAPYAERRPYDQYGHSVALDGNTLLVGAWQADVSGNADQGVVYVYLRVDSSWLLQATLTAPNGSAGDRFGQAVAISGDTALIGAHNDDYGATINRGTVSVFVRTHATWTHQQTFSPADGEANDEFGCAVALSGDTALIGARFDDVVTAEDNNQGSAYVYTRSGTTWTQQQKLSPADRANYDLFGYSVALYGNTALVGAAYKGAQSQGAAYVFNRNGVTWTQTKKLVAADAAANDHFGTAVALDGSSAVVGAPQGTNAGVHTGAAYVFFCAPFSFSPGNLNLPFGRVGSSYSQTITASGGTSPYSYALVGGTLAPGLTLSAGGALSGTPTTVGNYYFYVQATDANGCTGTTSYALTISPPCPTITVNPATLPNGTRNVAYSQQLTASGGAAPYSFSATGTLPTGLILSGSGQVVGTPTVAGSFTFRAKATDANGCSGLRQYTVTTN